MSLPEQVFEKMWSKDHFSQWLGLEISQMTEGVCHLHFIVRPDMLNGHQTVHGGVLFSAADSAFAFACNSHGRVAVGLDTSMSFTKAAKAGEKLTVVAEEQYLGNKIGAYTVKIWNERGETIALFKGTSYRTNQGHFEN
jgi:acyl-CoA thioesterase